jgi:HEAT repeat protein
MERLFLDYLEKNKSGPGAGDGSHLVACYQALGKCGSKRCLPFLEEILFKKSWKNLFKSGESDLHMGAALALSNLDLPEASALLKKGASSLQADTRNACKKVLGVASS